MEVMVVGFQHEKKVWEDQDQLPHTGIKKINSRTFQNSFRLFPRAA